MPKNVLGAMDSFHQPNRVKLKQTNERVSAKQINKPRAVVAEQDYFKKAEVSAQQPDEKGISLWQAGLTSMVCLGVGVIVTGFALKWGKGNTVAEKEAQQETQKIEHSLSAEMEKAWNRVKNLADHHPTATPDQIVGKLSNEIDCYKSTIRQYHANANPNPQFYIPKEEKKILEEKLEETERTILALQKQLSVRENLKPFTEVEVQALNEELKIPRHSDFEPPQHLAEAFVFSDDHTLMELPPKPKLPVSKKPKPPLATVKVDDLANAKKVQHYDIDTNRKRFSPVSFEEPASDKKHRRGWNTNAVDILPEYKISIPIDRPDLGVTLETDFTIEYGKIWDVPKIMRDFLQNFFDAHREAETGKSTLEGVKIAVEPIKGENATIYALQVKGDAVYPIRFIEEIGATTKKNDAVATGGFGEGAKMAALALLGKEDSKVKSVTFACDNWQVQYTKGRNTLGTEKLYKTVTRLSKPIKGNTLTIETQAPEAVKALLDARNYFYHPQNPDFQNPTYENAKGGFKLLEPKEEQWWVGDGNFYYVGQRQAVGDGNNQAKFDNSVRHMHLWSNEKDTEKNPTNIAGRDRTALSHEDIKAIVLKPMVEVMTNEDLLNNLSALKKYWDNKTRDYEDAHNLAILIAEEMATRKLYTTFPETYVAYPHPTSFKGGAYEMSDYLNRLNEIAKKLDHDGFTICDRSFHSIGMQSLLEREALQSTFPCIQPTQQQTIRLNLLNKVALHFRDAYIAAKENGYSFGTGGSPLIQDKMIDLPLYIYDEHEGLNKEHIQGFVKGLSHIGMSKGQLNSAFSQALATYLHEITHVHGSDGSASFSYKLTDMLELVLKTAPLLAEKLQQYEKFWNDSLAEEATLTAVV